MGAWVGDASTAPGTQRTASAKGAWVGDAGTAPGTQRAPSAGDGLRLHRLFQVMMDAALERDGQ